jgi:hypothetical protein
MSNEELRNKCALKISFAYAVLHAFLKDGHYNHSPQIHPIGVPIGMFGATVFSLCNLRVLCASEVV